MSTAVGAISVFYFFEKQDNNLYIVFLKLRMSSFSSLFSLLTTSSILTETSLSYTLTVRSMCKSVRSMHGSVPLMYGSVCPMYENPRQLWVLDSTLCIPDSRCRILDFVSGTGCQSIVGFWISLAVFLDSTIRPHYFLPRKESHHLPLSGCATNSWFGNARLSKSRP